MTLVVIHAGFHKTGTTSVQTALTENAERLAPHLRVLLKPDFKPLTDAARACSVAPGDQSVAAVGRRAARLDQPLGALAMATPARRWPPPERRIDHNER